MSRQPCENPAAWEDGYRAGYAAAMEERDESQRLAREAYREVERLTQLVFGGQTMRLLLAKARYEGAVRPLSSDLLRAIDAALEGAPDD